MAKNRATLAMCDIKPPERGNLVVAGQEINLKTKTNEVGPHHEEPQFQEPQEIRHLDDLVSNIIEGDLKDDIKRELENVIASADDPVVELAKVGAVMGKRGKWGGDLRTKDGYTEAPLSKTQLSRSNLTGDNFTSRVKLPEQLLRSDLNIEVRPLKTRGTGQDEDFYKKIINKIHEPSSPRVVLASSSFKSSFKSSFNTAKEPKARIIGEEVVSFYKNEPVLQKTTTAKTFFPEINFPKSKLLNFISPTKKKWNGFWLIFLVVLGIGVYGLILKNELIQGGVIAFENLETAGESLKRLQFGEAAEKFSKSYQDLSQISQTMNFMGAGLISFFDDLPGLDLLDKLGAGKITAGGADKIKSAKDLIEAGKLIAQAGEELSEALNFLSMTGSILNPSLTPESGQVGKTALKPLRIINEIKNAVFLSSKNFQKAKALISNIDVSSVPEDKRQKFADFKDKLPLFEEYIGDAVEYINFLEGIVGIDASKKYLLLFNNFSELRPTGGFPGTYGVVSFSGGGLADFFVDDVYNLDGQLKRNVIPPKQLQHITPTLGMRDSSWFIDFPTSSKKAMKFFAEEAGYEVNGVIALNPDIVSGILGIVGPIKMPEYGMTLTADNFLESVQEEVEYGDNRRQPKRVVVDFAPRFLEKLYSADSEKWMAIFNLLMSGLEEKDILFYFEDGELENFALKEGFGGEVKNTAGDYLTVNFSNIKGSKTDVVTDSAVEIESEFKDDYIARKVKIIRNHRGGDHEHGFYNRQNPAYVRVLIPEGAELLNVTGNDLPNFQPLVNYNLTGDFERDRDLALFESSFRTSKFAGADVFEESGKTGIGFWMITDPGKTKTVELEYSVPFNYTEGGDYNFYFQKQPGLDWKNFKFTFKNDGEKPLNTTPEFNRIGDLYILDQELKTDIEIKISRTYALETGSPPN